MPLLFVPGATVSCPHATGLVVHYWSRMNVDGVIVAMVLCGETLRLYVHEGDRDVIERWRADHPGRLIALTPAGSPA